MVIEMYDARKEAKDYLEYYASPDENSKLEEYKNIIREEFYPERRREPKTRFSVCRKAVVDFKKLKPSADALAELMLSYMEYAIEFTYDYGDMWEQYYDSVEGNFDKTVQFIAKNGLWEKYDKRLQQFCEILGKLCRYFSCILQYGITTCFKYYVDAFCPVFHCHRHMSVCHSFCKVKNAID